MKYLILQNPGHNKVYFNSSEKLAIAELNIATKNFSCTISEINPVEIARIRYISFTSNTGLSSNDLYIISKLSFVYAFYIFEEKNNKKLLVPLELPETNKIDSRVSSLLKYQGKTNELFTKLMINLALFSSRYSKSDEITLLDPVSGKGTTLFEASTYGFNTIGIEIESKLVQESTVFFKKFLELEKIKHKFSKRWIYGKNKNEATNINEFNYFIQTKSKNSPDEYKLGVINGNASDSYKYFKKQSFNLIVGDLPYGIYHGNKNQKKQVSKTRNPSELLIECLPELFKVLKPGGSIVLAWNSFLVSRMKLSEIFMENAFNVLEKHPYDSLEHMVDKSIKRDIIVATKDF